MNDHQINELLENLEAWGEEFRANQHGATLTILRAKKTIADQAENIAQLERERNEWQARSDMNARDWRRQCLKSGDLENEMSKICATITGHCPRELCTTAEAVAWLVERHKAATSALYKLEEIRTEKLATKGLSVEASAVSAARVILQSQREAAGTDDEKPDGQAENAKSAATGSERNENE